MIHRSSIRRIAKWTGLVVCAMLLIAWVLTGMHSAFYWGQTTVVGYGYGTISLLVLEEAPPGTYGYSHWHDFHLIALPQITHRMGTGFVLPIWILLLIAALPTAYLFYRDRRPPPGHCQPCGYDLKGNVSGVCPERGRAT